MQLRIFVSFAQLEQRFLATEVRALVAKARYLSLAELGLSPVSDLRAARREWQDLLSECRHLEHVMLDARDKRDHSTLAEYE
jgi:hypothetical protein